MAYYIAVVAIIAAPFAAILPAAAATDTSGPDFNIQVSPSPISVTLTPGKAQTVSLSVRNASNHSETLYPRLNGFTIDKKSRNIKLSETPPADMVSWTSFRDSPLVLPAGATKQLQIDFATPADVGFSYTAIITLARSPNTPLTPANLQLRGVIAVFCLININRPDAKSQLSINTVQSDKGQYQFLPARFNLEIQNRGNVISQPTGSLFIQRSFDSAKPIATLPINKENRYLLPGTSRNFDVSWSSGFPVYIQNADGKRRLSWDWKHLSDLRFGRYVAKAVVVYNDGHRDVPVIASTTFWVIPWGLILGSLFIAIILLMGIIGWGRLIFNSTRKVKTYAIHRK